MALKDHPVDESEATEEGLSLISPQRPHDDASLVPSSEVPPPPSSDDDSEGNEDLEMALWTFNEAHMKRYEACRRSGFDNSEMNRMLAEIIEKDVPKDIKTVLSAAGKLFVGYLVETALEVMSESNDSGPIRAEHVAESYRRLIHEGRMFESSSGRDKYLKALSSGQITESSSASQPIN